MTKLQELYRAKGKDALIVAVRELSDGRLLAELDDTIQFDIMHADDLEWMKNNDKKVYNVIKSELYDRLDTDTRRLRSEAENEALSIIESRAVGRGLDDLLAVYVIFDGLLKRAYEMDDEYYAALYKEVCRILDSMITGRTLEAHGYVYDTSGDSSIWRKED